MLVENISLEIGLYRNYSAQPVITDQAVITGIFVQIKSYLVLINIDYTHIFCEKENCFILYINIPFYIFF